MTKRFIETSLRLLFVALVITLIVPLGEGTAVEEGMVLYLSFDEDGDPTDSSDNPTDVTVHGTLNKADDQFGGHAIEFDGDSANFIEVAHASKLVGMEALTIAAWAMTTNADALARGIVSKRAGFNNADVYQVFSWNDVKMYARVNAQNSEQTQMVSETVLESDVWYHFVVVFDGNAPETERGKMYVNGTLEGMFSHPDRAIGDSDASLWIGTLNGGYAQTWLGLIDELRVFDRALSEDDILQLIAGPTPVKPRGKLATTWARIKHQ